MLKSIKSIVGKYALIACLLSGSFVLTTTTTSCTKKVGCAAESNVGPKTKRNGSLSKKRGKSTLFGKKHRRRMKH